MYNLIQWRTTQEIFRNVSAIYNILSMSSRRPLDPAITVAHQLIRLQNKQVYKVFNMHLGKKSLRGM